MHEQYDNVKPYWWQYTLPSADDSDGNVSPSQVETYHSPDAYLPQGSTTNTDPYETLGAPDTRSIAHSSTFFYQHFTYIDHDVCDQSANNTSTATTSKMPSKARVEPSIPLFCSLCPKNPQFSDTSHLLTHISSKSHLANLFKLRIRAQGEQDAKDQLDAFDFWYHHNNLDALLADRLASKDQKKAAKEQRGRTSNGSKRVVKKEEPMENGSLLDTTPIFRAPVPRMHLADDDEWGIDSLYATPTTRRRVPNFTNSPKQGFVDPSLNFLDQSLYKSPYKTTPKKKTKTGENLPEKSPELKGIVWPGMNLFDSATHDMKRMRNQRKDGNIMKQMMATSAQVEPAEVSYFADGHFRASRDIFGPLSDDEDIPVKEPTPKRRRKPRKATLKDVHANVPRGRPSRGRVSGGPGRNSEKVFSSMPSRAALGSYPSAAYFMKSAPTLNPLALAHGSAFVPSTDEEEEFKMTVGEVKKKRAFGVYQDAPGESPSGKTESSLEDHRFDIPNPELPSYRSNSTSTRHTSPTPAPKPVSMRGRGKENIVSSMRPQIQARQPSEYASHVYPSQVFYNPSLNPLYTHAYAGGFGVGGHLNIFDETRPLSALASTFNQDPKPSSKSVRFTQPRVLSEDDGQKLIPRPSSASGVSGV